MVEKRTLQGIMVVLIAALVVTSMLAAFYLLQYQQEAAAASSEAAEVKYLDSRFGALMTSSLLVNFGNGTVRWYNGTRIQPGWNLYTETLAATNGRVNATCCAYGSHFVTGIDGVQSVKGGPKSWIAWTFNGTSSWQEANLGADELPVTNGSEFAWTFCAYNPVTYAPECSP
jgi:hypothetical protein